MNRLLLPGLALLLAPLAPAQEAPRPKATPAATPRPRPQMTDERQLIETGSFDKPKVAKRSPVETVPDLLRFTHGEWVSFGPNPAAKGSGLSTGLTNEASRTGKQSVYVNFEHVKKPGAFVVLSSGQIPVKPSLVYRVHLWGRMDAVQPIILDQRVPVLRMQVEFFQADGETGTGEPIIKVQPIPGTPNRPLFFTADRWTEFYNDATAPDDAAFVKVTWSFGTTNAEGETNGVVFFDDFGISGERVPGFDPDAPEPAEPAAPAQTDAKAAAEKP